MSAPRAPQSDQRGSTRPEAGKHRPRRLSAEMQPWEQRFQATRIPPGMEDRIGHLLFRLSMHIRQEFTAAIAPLGIHPRHFGMLAILANTGPVSQLSLGKMAGLDPSTMVFLVDELESMGLLERRRNPRDRRANELHLTAKGKAKLARASAKGIELEESILQPLDEKARQEFRATVRLLLQNQARA